MTPINGGSRETNSSTLLFPESETHKASNVDRGGNGGGKGSKLSAIPLGKSRLFAVMARVFVVKLF